MQGPRITPLPPDERDEEISTLLAAVAVGDGELNIFATLARHPKLLKNFMRFGGALLFAGELSPRDRELLILRTGANTRSEYEWGQHVRIGREAGLTDEEIRRAYEGPDAGGWTDLERALLQAADELHASARISDDTWAVLRERYDDRQLIELCMLVGQYHLVAFTLNSLGVEGEPGLEGFPS